MNLIYSYDEIEKYYNQIMFPLGKLEVYFVSLSARNKYLTEEERIILNLGRTEMFDRKTFRGDSFLKFKSLISRYDSVNEVAYLSKSGVPIPAKCLMCYININPSNMLNSYFDFQKVMNEYLREFTIVKTRNSKDDDISSRIQKSHSVFMNSIQKTKGTQYWIDIDFDSKEPTDKWILDRLLYELRSKFVEYKIIETHGGYHVLMKKSTVKFNYNEIVLLCDERLKKNDPTKEVIVNSNAMVPLPGTMQGDFPVRLVDNVDTIVV